MKPRPTPTRHAALGMLLLAAGRRAGFAHFGTDRDAYLGSLAPLLGFAIVGCLIRVLAGQVHVGLLSFLVALCSVLAPVIIADLFCRVWRRTPFWARFATVLTWSQWLMVLVLGMLLVGAKLAATLVPAEAALSAVSLVFFLYMLWFDWFVARHTLDLSRGRAFAVSLAVIFGTLVLLVAPLYAGGVPALSTPPAAANGSAS